LELRYHLLLIGENCMNALLGFGKLGFDVVD